MAGCHAGSRSMSWRFLVLSGPAGPGRTASAGPPWRMYSHSETTATKTISRQAAKNTLRSRRRRSEEVISRPRLFESIDTLGRPFRNGQLRGRRAAGRPRSGSFQRGLSDPLDPLPPAPAGPWGLSGRPARRRRRPGSSSIPCCHAPPLPLLTATRTAARARSFRPHPPSGKTTPARAAGIGARVGSRFFGPGRPPDPSGPPPEFWSPGRSRLMGVLRGVRSRSRATRADLSSWIAG